MAQAETNIANDIMKDLARGGVTLFRNVKGLFTSPDGRRKIQAGLIAPGSSDLVGFRRVVITPEMVDQTVALFVALEVKKDGGYPSPAQKDFCEFISQNGGYAGIARSTEDARKIVKLPVDIRQKLP